MPGSFVMEAQDRARIADAVKAAESGTSGEIVTIIADHSDRYLDVALWWAVVLAAVAVASLAAFPALHRSVFGLVGGGWSGEPGTAELFELALAALVLKFAAIRLILQYWPLRVWLTPATVRRVRVRRRAVRYFKVGAEHRTTGRTGILIYLSMAERRAEIVTDEAVHSLVPDDSWGEAMADLIGEVRQGRVAEGMIKAIADIGVILSDHLPRTAGDINEMPDRLIEL